jgi:hypothetical protein
MPEESIKPIDESRLKAITGLEGIKLQDALSNVNRILLRQEDAHSSKEDWQIDILDTVAKLRRQLNTMPKFWRDTVREKHENEGEDENENKCLMDDFEGVFFGIELILDIENVTQRRFRTNREASIYYLNQRFGKEKWFIKLIAEAFELSLETATKAVQRCRVKHPH